ncbi:MAG: small multidrug resistance family (SMR) protein, partial [uncultured Pseudonocardia sp.]
AAHHPDAGSHPPCHRPVPGQGLGDAPARRRLRDHLRPVHRQDRGLHRPVALGARHRRRRREHLLPHPGPQDPRRRSRLHRLDRHRLGRHGPAGSRALRRIPQPGQDRLLRPHHRRRHRPPAVRPQARGRHPPARARQRRRALRRNRSAPRPHPL